MTTSQLDTILHYWGKADPNYPGTPKWHPLAYHSLDVAACGQELLRQQPAWLENLSRLSGMDACLLEPWLIFLLAVHDLGKFSNGFQALPKNPFGRIASVAYDVRHDTLGYALAMECLPQWLKAPELAERGGNLLRLWVAAVTGHHGRPPKNLNLTALIGRQFPAETTRCDAAEFVSEMRRLLLPTDWAFPSRTDGQLDRYKQVSWLLSGLAVLADWLGSNTLWFKYRAPDKTLEQYWQDIALPAAQIAVQESGLTGSSPAPSATFGALFPHIESPTPLQVWANEVAIEPKPQLFVLEELTGGGKTEAALTLAARLMAAGCGQGVYFALPTMATADAMFDRIDKKQHDTDLETWKRFFASADPSLVLAHSAARVRQKLDALQQRDSGYDHRNEEASASQHSSAWLADSRKKALFADFGVGTIDQALLAVMPLRHQSLRLLGLSTKVLVVDEVHACDCYMGELLSRLLRFHAALGGSAILLSATLPSEQRARLLAAFAEGSGYKTIPPEKGDYPLATHFHAAGLNEQPIAARKAASRKVSIQPLADTDAVSKRLHASIERGGCAVWVRNTVADAVAAWTTWNKDHPDTPATLFHARFALCDRLEIGKRIHQNFGPTSTLDTRRHKLVIATQVIEQSLDVDFDDMVSDLAPIDLIVQRAGRLQRHKRNADGSPAKEDQRGGANLGVLMPEPILEAEAAWLKRLLSKAAKVYPDHGKLWLTAHWLHQHKSFDLTEQARDMIESVYGADGFGLTPVALQEVTVKAEGKCKADQGIARSNVLSFNQGYDPTSNEWPDEDSYTDITTRLGEKTVRLRLAKLIDGKLAPWASTGTHLDWALSELAVARYLVAKESARHAGLLEQTRQTMIDEGRHCLIVPLEDCGADWRGWAANEKNEAVRVIYSPVAGLSIEKGEAIDESDL
jgi:CRISPR-associated endonuclease/helicase Cas3